MKICRTCGTQNEDTFSSCVACGANLETTGNYSTVGDDEVTTLLEPLDANGSTAPSMNNTPNAFGQAPQMNFQQGQMGTGMPQNDFGGQMGFQPQMQNGAYSNPPMQQSNKPAKSNNKVAFIVLGAIVVVAIVALVLIFGFGGKKVKGGANSPEQVAEKFVEGMDKRDTELISSLCLPFLDSQVDEIEDIWLELESYDISYEFLEVTRTYDYSSSEVDDLEEDIEYYYDTKVKLDAACDVDFDYNLAVNFMGESYSEPTSDSLVAIKYKGKWFLLE